MSGSGTQKSQSQWSRFIPTQLAKIKSACSEWWQEQEYTRWYNHLRRQSGFVYESGTFIYPITQQNVTPKFKPKKTSRTCATDVPGNVQSSTLATAEIWEQLRAHQREIRRMTAVCSLHRLRGSENKWTRRRHAIIQRNLNNVFFSPLETHGYDKTTQQRGVLVSSGWGERSKDYTYTFLSSFWFGSMECRHWLHSLKIP